MEKPTVCLLHMIQVKHGVASMACAAKHGSRKTTVHSQRQYYILSQDQHRFLCLVTFDGFPTLTVEHFYVKFGDPSCMGF